MNKIPKGIVDKIEQRNKLNEEIAEWCKENLDMDGMSSDFADITSYHSGEEQGDDNCKEWCNQQCLGEDWYAGHITGRPNTRKNISIWSLTFN